MSTSDVPDMTVVMIDGLYHPLSRLALDSVLSCLRPKEVLIFGTKNFGPTGTRYIESEIKSEEDALRILHKKVPPEIRTSHYLYLHWDSGVRNPKLWTDEFLQYDYIGAPWPWHFPGTDVGNGGFSIRSKRLGMVMAGFPFEYKEDDYICRQNRQFLEEAFSIKFAPRALAERFSLEHGDWQAFGFHGLWNFARLYTEPELIRRIGMLPAGFSLDRADSQMLLQVCHTMGYTIALQMMSRFGKNR